MWAAFQGSWKCDGVGAGGGTQAGPDWRGHPRGNRGPWRNPRTDGCSASAPQGGRRGSNMSSGMTRRSSSSSRAEDLLMGVLALQGAGRWACPKHIGTHEDSQCYRERRGQPCLQGSLCLLLSLFSVGLILSFPLLSPFLLRLLFSSTHTLLPSPSPAPLQTTVVMTRSWVGGRWGGQACAVSV